MIIYHWDNLLAEILNSVFLFCHCCPFSSESFFFYQCSYCRGVFEQWGRGLFYVVGVKIIPFLSKTRFYYVKNLKSGT